MLKATVGFLLITLVSGASTTSQADPVTWEYVNINFDQTVTALNNMRRFARACSLSPNAEQIARDFVISYSAKARVDALELNQLVERKYANAPGAQLRPRACEIEYLTFWTDSFHLYSQQLYEVLALYKQQK